MCTSVKDIKDEIIQSPPECILDKSFDEGCLPGTPPHHGTVHLSQQRTNRHHLDVMMGRSE